MNNALSKLDGKFFESKLKKGIGITQITQDFQITEDVLLQHIRKTFSSKASEQICRRLQKNESLYQKHISTKRRVNKSKAKEFLKMMDESKAVTSSEKTKFTLADLEKEKNTKTEELEKMLGEQKTLNGEKAKLLKLFTAQQKKLLKLQSQIKNLNASFKENHEKWEAIGKKLDLLDKDISVCKDCLDTLHKKIEAERKLSIFVYSEGNIEYEGGNGFDTSANTDDLQKVLSIIASKTEAETFTLKIVKQLAEVVVVIQKAKTANIQYEVNFENSDLEEVCKSIIN